MLVGAALGLIAAGVVAWSWTRWGRRLNMGAILKVTALFLGLFLVQLLVYGIHELAESGVIHGSQAFHDADRAVRPRRAASATRSRTRCCSRRCSTCVWAPAAARAASAPSCRAPRL